MVSFFQSKQSDPECFSEIPACANNSAGYCDKLYEASKRTGEIPYSRANTVRSEDAHGSHLNYTFQESGHEGDQLSGKENEMPVKC